MSIENRSLDFTRNSDVVSYINEKKYPLADGFNIVASLVDFMKSGMVPDQKKITVKYKDGADIKDMEIDTIDMTAKTFGDAISVSELRDLIPIAVQYIIRDEIEANTPFTSIFDVIPYDGTEVNLSITDMPPIEVNEVVGGEYRQFTINFGSTNSERINITVKTYGGLLAISKDFMKTPYSSTYIGTIFKKIGNAFARKKEAIVQQVITNSNAVILYDNGSGTTPRLGKTSGRDISGSFNDTLAPFDLMNAYIYGYTNFGVYYDTIIMHPFAWSAFIMTPQLKSLLVGPDGSTKFPPFPTGHTAPGFPNFRPYNKLYPNANVYGTPDINNPEFKLDPSLAKLGTNPYNVYPSFMWSEWTTNPNNGFFNSPLHIIVTPSVPFQANGTNGFITDLIMADSKNVGAVFQAQNPQVREKGRTDNFEDVILYKFDEKYGVMPYLRGEGFGLIKNIKLDRQYVFENNNSVTITNDGSGRGEFTL